jgi:hypothetical protein
LLTAFDRVVEIALGCVIGNLTAHLVLPDRARAAIETGTAAMLEGLGKVAAAHLTGTDAARIDALNAEVRRHLMAVSAAAVARHLADAAGFVRGAARGPALAALDAAVGTVPEASALGFALSTLRRDLADLDERLAEHIAG